MKRAGKERELEKLQAGRVDHARAKSAATRSVKLETSPCGKPRVARRASPVDPAPIGQVGKKVLTVRSIAGLNRSPA